MTRTLFVYGTLRSEFNNRFACLLRSQAELIAKVSVHGSIYLLGDYPGWKEEPACTVRGELYQLRSPEETLKALDDYEGEDFERVEIETASAPSKFAWIYRYKNDPPENSVIASGDFCHP